jgi:hypothetical protein
MESDEKSIRWRKRLDFSQEFVVASGFGGHDSLGQHERVSFLKINEFEVAHYDVLYCDLEQFGVQRESVKIPAA